MRRVLLSLVFLFACKRAPSAVEARGMIASADAETRRVGGAALQKIYVKDPKALGDHGETYWALRVKGLPGASADETQRILDGAESAGGEGGGGGSTRHYRLDDFWTMDLYRDDRRGTTTGYEPPRRNVVHVDVARPPDFTGTWTTYFVNGAVHDAFEVERGIAKRDREYHDDGQLRREHVFVGGKLEGAVVTRFANGTPEWEESYAKGKLVGVQRWFYRSGLLRQEDHWADDRRDGRTTFYAEDGSVTQCIDYRAGVEVDRGCKAPGAK